MPGDKKRILCVDDDADTCFMLSTLFRQNDYEVGTAGGAEEALRLARSDSFDLYVLDLQFGDGAGLDLCRHIRTLHPHARIVFFTGHAHAHESRPELLDCAEAYLAKPEVGRLVETVTRLLQ